MTCSSVSAGTPRCPNCGAEVRASFIMCSREKRSKPMSPEDQRALSEAMQRTAMSMHDNECPKRTVTP